MEQTLQTGFQVGMENLLGATTHSKVHSLKKTLAETDKFVDAALGTPVSALDAMDPTSPHFQAPDINELRTDVHKADMLDQEEQRDVRASRYERMFWESVPEDGRVSQHPIRLFLSTYQVFPGTTTTFYLANR
jgi:hypothetical protein